MIGTTLVREPPAVARPGLSRTAAPPVLIKVPTLPGAQPHRRRGGARGRISQGRPRRRLRRSVRLALLVTSSVAGTVAVASVIAPRTSPSMPAVSEAPPLDPMSPGSPFVIELEPPIPEPAPPLDGEPLTGSPPVAFPGYLLPGDAEEERGHERP